MDNTHWLQYAHGRLKREGIIKEHFRLMEIDADNLELDETVLDSVHLFSQADIRELKGKQEVPLHELRRKFRLLAKEVERRWYPYQTHGQVYHRALSDTKNATTVVNKMVFPITMNNGQQHYRAISCIELEAKEKWVSSFRVCLYAGNDLAVCAALLWDDYSKRAEQRKGGKSPRDLASRLDSVQDLFAMRGSSREEKKGDLNIWWNNPAACIDAAVDLAISCVSYWGECAQP